MIESAYSQQFNFSLLSYAEQRLNPAYAATDNYWAADALHRSQQTAPDFSINSTSFSFKYPHLMPNRQNVQGGFGLNVMNDQSGSTNTFEVQEIGLSYALQFKSGVGEALSFGISGFHHKQGFTFANFLTNTQYIPDRGFDSSINNGESLQELSDTYYRINTGVLYQLVNSNGQTISRLGFSIFDINRPQSSFFNTGSKVPPTYMGELAFSIYQTPKLNVTPNFLWVHHTKRNRLNIGLASEYKVANDTKIGLGLKYLLGRDLISSIELKKGNLSIGMAYDLSVNAKNSANTGAFEVGLRLQGLVREREKRKKSKAKKPEQTLRPILERRVNLQPIILPNYKPLAKLPIGRISVKSTKPAKTGTAQVEQSYTFNYSLNQFALKQRIKEELSPILNSLMDDEIKFVTIEGHTDNTGGAELNNRLSLTRAQTIADYLIENGVSAKRIKVRGYGEEIPISNNNTPLGRAMNRRVVISVFH
tara:strand:- start:1999 stop:3429 length:1431 start_codon:yes stop_codon:yes gene_type:complete